MRIHVPNNDRLFPGRSDSQIVATDQGTEPEWAADKITNHSRSGNDVIFEVLWKSGDITWIPYMQIRDLNLLEPYLEALGADGIANLPHGSSTPPRDPQIFIGNLMFPQAIKTALDFQSYHTTTPLPLDHLHISTVTMPLHSLKPMKWELGYQESCHVLPKNFRITSDNLGNETYLITFTDGVHPIHINPVQLDSYCAFDLVVRKDMNYTGPVPLGYEHFTVIWNNSGHKSKFSVRAPDMQLAKVKIEWIATGPPSPGNRLFTAVYHDPHYDALHKANLIDDNGMVNHATLASYKSAVNTCLNMQHQQMEWKNRWREEWKMRKQGGHTSHHVEAHHAASEAFKAHKKCEKRKERKAKKERAQRNDTMDVDTTILFDSPTTTMTPIPGPSNDTMVTQSFAAPAFTLALQLTPNSSIQTTDSTITTVTGNDVDRLLDFRDLDKATLAAASSMLNHLQEMPTGEMGELFSENDVA